MIQIQGLGKQFQNETEIEYKDIVFDAVEPVPLVETLLKLSASVKVML